jgi:hypothetical protein
LAAATAQLDRHQHAPALGHLVEQDRWQVPTSGGDHHAIEWRAGGVALGADGGEHGHVANAEPLKVGLALHS